MKTKRKLKPEKLAIAAPTIEDFNRLSWELKTAIQNARMFGGQANTLHTALIDLLAFWDRVPKAIEPRDGWTEHDARRLQEIRKLVTSKPAVGPAKAGE